MNEFKEFNLSNHAKERYAERIMGKDNTGDIKRFILANEDKILTDINKLIYYGDLIYTGEQFQKNGKNNIIDVYLKDTWIVLADNESKLVITLYKIDLGLDDEFNKIYVNKMLDKLNEKKKKLADITLQINNETNTYKGLISDCESQIKEYKTMIKNLEELCDGYRLIIANNNVAITQSNKDVANTVNTMIGKKEF